MGKLPASMFYWGDWSRDLEEYPLEVEGAWIRICCKLHYSETRGTLSRTLEQWAKILRQTPETALKILREIQQAKIGDISPDLAECNGNVTVSCRRITREEKDRQDNKNRVFQFRHKNKSNGNVTQMKRKCNASRVRVTETETEDENVSLASASLAVEVKKLKYLEFVYLFEKQYEKLVEKLGVDKTKEMIARLDTYIGQIGERVAKKKYDSHYHTIINWVARDEKEGKSGTGKSGGLQSTPGKYARAGEITPEADL